MQFDCRQRVWCHWLRDASFVFVCATLVHERDKKSYFIMWTPNSLSAIKPDANLLYT